MERADEAAMPRMMPERFFDAPMQQLPVRERE
jgi:hypothetical protein